MVWLVVAGVAFLLLVVLAWRERRRGVSRGVDKQALFHARVRDSRKVTPFMLRK